MRGGHGRSNRKTLKVHMKALHLDQRPFKCEHPGCALTFMTRPNLDSHMNKHLKAEEKQGQRLVRASNTRYGL